MLASRLLCSRASGCQAYWGKVLMGGRTVVCGSGFARAPRKAVTEERGSTGCISWAIGVLAVHWVITRPAAALREGAATERSGSAVVRRPRAGSRAGPRRRRRHGNRDRRRRAAIPR